jgi:hypothetical protein
MQNRWYDNDPVIGLAINMLHGADLKVQDYCAQHIIEQAKISGIELSQEELAQKTDCFWQRRENDSIETFKAMEYFQLADFDTKREISLWIAEYIKNAETN